MNFLRLVLVAATFTTSVSMSHAQTPGAMQQQRDRMARMDRDRVANDLTSQMSRDRRGRKLNPGQVLSAANSGATKAGLYCKVTEAALLGVTNEDGDLFEIDCESGPGYIFTSPLQFQPLDCDVLAEMVAAMKADGLTPPPNSACKLKGNQPAG